MSKLFEKAKIVFSFVLRNKFRAFCLVLVLAIAFGTYNYMTTDNTSEATLSLNYAESSNGLNPNKTRFNCYEIVSYEVISNAIKLAGLQDTVKPEQLSRCMSVSPVDTGNVSGDDEYISTTYRITLNTASIDIKNRNVVDIMKNICKAYKAYFLQNYCYNQSVAKIQLGHNIKDEPYKRVNDIKLRVNQLYRYIESRLSENKSYVDSNENSFTKMNKRIKNIIDYDIPNTMAYIVEEGVAKNSNTLNQILEYKNKILNMSAQKNLKAYEADNNGIDMYESSMSSVVLIPTTDGMEQYYMSRTKTAMDYMAVAANSEVKEETDDTKIIEETKYVISKMQAGDHSTDKLAYAEKLVEELETAVNSLSDDLVTLDKSYIDYKSLNYITFFYNSYY